MREDLDWLAVDLGTVTENTRGSIGSGDDFAGLMREPALSED